MDKKYLDPANNAFKLIGFENTLGLYPSSVQPICEIGNEFFAVYAKPNKIPTFINIPTDDLERKRRKSFINLDSKKYKHFRIKFNPFTDSLFAFSKKEIESYPTENRLWFYRKILVERNIISNAPFVALPIALITKDQKLIRHAVLNCSKRLEYSPNQLGFWYSDLKKKIKFLPESITSLQSSHKKKLSLLTNQLNFSVLVKLKKSGLK